MKQFRLLLLAGLLAAGAEAGAFESDVHYGLTQWLALKAGFEPRTAETIAVGDNRVDSGDMQFVDLVFMYACVGKDDVGSRRAGEHDYPSAVIAPAAPDARVVLPGGEAARKAALGAVKVPPDQAAYRLLKLGEALHILQDSWSHQGTPGIPEPADGSFACDPTRAWGHPKARGGWNSHKADLTMYWPADTIAMAKATYDVLTQYPAVSGAKRTPRNWEEIRPALDRFVAASTKSEKRRWFASQGMDDVSFLEGISLRDGAQPFELRWPGRKLPPLGSSQSRQHYVQADLLDFFNRFFARWVSSTDFEAMATEFGPNTSPHDANSRSAVPKQIATAELATRLKVWRLRDHGRIANIAHSVQPLTARERATVDAVAKEPNAYAHFDRSADAFFPLLPRGNDASPLLPFFVAPIGTPGGNPTAVAVTKFRHLPYDTVAVVAEQVGGRWRVVSIDSTVDH
ncbi:MAG TPA: hypothetical protein VG425_01450 [Casimicrobiaceae bacterium]|nr:hypothetical protein [Casimicrobiaceae bacterium]